MTGMNQRFLDRHEKVIFVSIILGLAVGISCMAFAKEEDQPKKEEPSNFKYQTITTKEGLTFRVPEDMPIEKRGGIQAPIPFDEYMYGKFKQIDNRLKNIEQKLDEIQKALQKETKFIDSGR